MATDPTARLGPAVGVGLKGEARDQQPYLSQLLKTIGRS